MRVRLTQIDGKLPNLALMRLSAWHKARGDEVYFTRSARRNLLEPARYDRVYGSAIFAFSNQKTEAFLREFPGAIVGGTGSGNWHTLEDVVGADIPHEYDYSLYPNYPYSIGFLQRGCRLKCGFCVVPKKEGKPRQEMTVGQLWRGPGHPKKLHILDNDFFGVPGWQRHVEDIRSGGFKICLNQGINVRLIHEEGAAALASLEYRDDQFQQRRIYTAWDNLKDERIFFRGVDMLEAAGIPPKHIMVYMLVGYDRRETWDRILYRYHAMRERGVHPYPMVYENRTYEGDSRTLKDFQRWAIRLAQTDAIPWSEYWPRKGMRVAPQANSLGPLWEAAE